MTYSKQKECWALPEWEFGKYKSLKARTKFNRGQKSDIQETQITRKAWGRVRNLKGKSRIKAMNAGHHKNRNEKGYMTNKPNAHGMIL